MTAPPTDILVDSFEIMTDDGATETVEIVIGGANDAASVTSGADDRSGAVLEDGPADEQQASGRIRFADADALESLAQVQSGVAGVYGVFSVDFDGRWTYDLDNGSPAVQALRDGETATDSFTVFSADGGTSEIVTITVSGSADPSDNAAPVAPDVDVLGDEDTTISGVVAATDADGDTLSYAPGGTAPMNGAISVDAATGAFDYTPDADFNGADSFTVLVDDGLGGTTEATVTVTVDPVNDDPVAADIEVFGAGDEVIAGEVEATDVDGDMLTYRLGDTEPENGAVVVDLDGGFEYTPNVDFTGDDVFSISVDDGQGGSAEVFVSVTVGGDNTPPVAPDVSVSGDEDTTISGVVAATDVDGDTLTYAPGATAPANGSVAIDPATGAFDYTPNPDFAGTDSFTVLVDDGEGGETEATVSVTVDAVADAATIGGALTGTATEDVATPATGRATVIDPDAGEAVFEAQTNTIGEYGAFSIDANGDWSYALDSSNGAVQALRDVDTPTERGLFGDLDAGTEVVVVTEVMHTNPHVTTEGAGDVGDAGDLDNRNARGSDFDGMTMTAVYADGSSETVTWEAISAASGEAVGTNITAEATDSTHFGGFMISTTAILTSLTIETLPGGKVFFDVGRSFEGGVGNTTNTGGGNGVLVIDSAPAISGAIQATYSGIIGVEGEGFKSDTYTTLEIDFSGLGAGGVIGDVNLGIDLDRLKVEGDIRPADDAQQPVTTPPTDVLYDAFTITTADGATETIEIAISGSNDAAALTGDFGGTVAEDGVLAASGRIRTNDGDTLESATEVQTDIAGVYGAFSIDNEGRWSYLLDNDSAAVQSLNSADQVTDVFDVHSLDGSANATVTITINGADEDMFLFS